MGASREQEGTAMQVKSEVFSTIAAQSEAAAPVVWGWLEPGSSALPHIQLRGNAVALGRGSGLHKSPAGAASPRGGSPRHSGFTEEHPLSAMSSACLTQTAPPRQASYCPQCCRAVLTSLAIFPCESLHARRNQTRHCFIAYWRAAKHQRCTPGARVVVCGRHPVSWHGN